jgi:lipid-binding SYLF domain-containing protein
MAESIKEKQIKKAVERSSNAARIFEAAAGAGNKGIPKELLDRAHAVAVFPRLVKTKFLIEHLTLSYGVVCTRLPGGWSYPAFYEFASAGIEFGIEFTLPGDKSTDVIMLFMNKDAAGWFQKGSFRLDGEKRAVKGDVGTLSDEQRDRLRTANIILYSVVGGVVAGEAFDSNFFNSFGTRPDNKLNKVVYGVKSSEILAGKQPVTKSLKQGVTDFQSALSRLLSPNEATGD